ncbi:Methyltransferase domain-containing protein [Mucilaginibacter pineti]|uniref:Methyltransferase domain-containing protein n=1 Tax=Mucilaginibacter pineti TaxID=1391627 RepID=A0A1G7MNC1_9SPHI|nr:class I SAM-dependent methyltransferase [Mucilaginibacter pineti]SDF63164.1 Methyltransferase domain-containing protein [Mucilaginibacter pineti]
MQNNLQQIFGNIDIYLFDQLLKGRFNGCRTVLDAGCGGGRNLVYFLQNGFEVHGIDQSAEAVEAVKQLSTTLAPANGLANFSISGVEDMPFEDNFFDLVICSAVLHFAHNQQHFDSMMQSLWRVLKPGGFLFARLASDIGIENLVKSNGNGRYQLPDGSERFLVNQQTLVNYTRQLGGTLYEPIKTTNVQNLRCMTTWCVRKNF